MDTDEFRAAIEQRISELAATRQKIADETPKVLDGHSDGRRVRYVKAEVAEETLRWVLRLWGPDAW